MSLLKDLYYEYFAEVKKPVSEEYQKLYGKSYVLFETLREKLQGENQKLFFECNDSEADLSALSDMEHFIEGFKYAFKLLLECLL